MNNQRQKGNVKRTDIRIPLPLYEELQKIAVERFNAPIHHISGKPEISSTLLELVRYGIQYLQLGLTAPYTDRVPDNINQRLEAIEQQLEQLVSSRLDSFSPKIQPLLAQKKEMEELFGCVASLRTENKILFKKVEELEKLIASGNAANESGSHKSDLPVTHLEDEKTSWKEATEEEDESHKGIIYSTSQPIIEEPEDLSKGLTEEGSLWTNWRKCI